MSPDAFQPQRKVNPTALAAIAIAVVGLLFPIPSCIELYNFPVGDAVRPMGQGVALFICGLGTPLVVIPIAVDAFYQDRASRWLGLTAAIISLIPFPLYLFLMRWIISAHNLTLNP